MELYPAAYNYSTRIHNALKHVIVICSTGLGKLADMELANALMRTAVNYRWASGAVCRVWGFCRNQGGFRAQAVSALDHRMCVAYDLGWRRDEEHSIEQHFHLDSCKCDITCGPGHH